MTIVDTHAHHVPRSLLDAIDGGESDVATVITEGDGHAIQLQGLPPTRALKPRLLDLEERGTWLREQGIDVQVIGTWADLFGYHLPPPEAARWTELLNRTLSEATDGEDRYRPLAALPMQDPEAAARTLGDAIDQGFAGAMIGTRIDRLELDDPTFEPVWRVAADVAAPIFVHPGFCVDERLDGLGLMNAVGRGNDTTIAAARLLLGGVLDRHPDLRLVLSHGGAALPILLGRLAKNHEITEGTADPRPGFERLYFDSVVLDPATLEHLCRVASPGHVLLGSDYPFPIGDLQPLQVVSAAHLDGDVATSIRTGGDALFQHRGSA